MEIPHQADAGGAEIDLRGPVWSGTQMRLRREHRIRGSRLEEIGVLSTRALLGMDQVCTSRPSCTTLSALLRIRLLCFADTPGRGSSRGSTRERNLLSGDNPS